MCLRLGRSCIDLQASPKAVKSETISLAAPGNELERLLRDTLVGPVHPANPNVVHEVVGKTALGLLGEPPRWGWQASSPVGTVPMIQRFTVESGELREHARANGRVGHVPS